MNDSEDIDYFNARATTERELSAAASNEAAALIHLKLAQCYERLAARQRSLRPTLNIVTDAAR